jgi:hypothetical protein
MTDELEAKPGEARSKGHSLPESNRGVKHWLTPQTTTGQRIQRSPPAGGGGAAQEQRWEQQRPPCPLDYSKMSQDELKGNMGHSIHGDGFSISAAHFVRTAFAAGSRKIKQALIDKIVKEQIKSLLSQFQTISVFVPGTTQPLPPGQIGPPSRKTVTFHAAYFINTDQAKATVKSARDTSHFGTIVKSRNDSGQTSLIESGGKKYGSGTAVRVGKATPENVRQFVQEALDNDTIRKYAVQKGKLAGNQQLAASAMRMQQR